MIDIMRLRKDGGPESRVWGYFLLAIKPLFSIVLLRFENGSREAYHSHAFNCVSWVLSGTLLETELDGGCTLYRPSWRPIITKRETFHKVVSMGRTWVLSFRGPWAKTWQEHTPLGGYKTLTWGRVEV
jgi:hypothetical protein